MSEKHLCANCLEWVDSHVEKRIEEHRVKGVTIHLNADVRVCDKCGEEMFDKDFDADTLQKAYAKYREKAGLLSIERMKQIREQYGLTQTAFARVLGLGDKTITRYESGSIPDEAPNNLIFVCESPETFDLLLEKNRSKLSADEFDKAKRGVVRLEYSCAYSYAYSLEGGAARGSWSVEPVPCA